MCCGWKASTYKTNRNAFPESESETCTGTQKNAGQKRKRYTRGQCTCAEAPSPRHEAALDSVTFWAAAVAVQMEALKRSYSLVKPILSKPLTCLLAYINLSAFFRPYNEEQNEMNNPMRTSMCVYRYIMMLYCCHNYAKCIFEASIGMFEKKTYGYRNKRMLWCRRIFLWIDWLLKESKLYISCYDP